MDIVFSSFYVIRDIERKNPIQMKNANTPNRSPPKKGLDFIRENLNLVLQEVETLDSKEIHRCDECENEYCVKENV